MYSGLATDCRPLMVARTRLIGSREPTAFASTSLTPTTSSTARIAPPAITPVPSEAGCMYTRAAPWLALTAYHRVPLFRPTVTMLRRARSIAFEIATGTSRALPYPKPTLPSPSPTTVSAVKLIWRPPLTVLATRLTAISFSSRPSEFSRSLEDMFYSVCPDHPGLLLAAWPLVVVCAARISNRIGDSRKRALSNPESRVPHPGASELQARLARRLGKRLDAAVIAETGAVERHRLHTGSLRALGHSLAHGRRSSQVLGALQAFGDRLLHGGGSRYHVLAGGVEHLRIKMLPGAMHRQAGHAQLADVAAGGLGAAQAIFVLVHLSIPRKRIGSDGCHLLFVKSPAMDDRSLRAGTAHLRLLGFLQGDLLAGIAHALALVGFGWAEAANLGCDLADDLLVGALDQHFGLGRRFDADALGRVEHHRVGEAQAEAQRLALHGGAITDADQLKLALVTLRDAGDHVGDQRTRRTAELVVHAFAKRDIRHAAVDGDRDARQLMHGQGALRALHRNVASGDRQLDALRQGNGLFGYT